MPTFPLFRGEGAGVLLGFEGWGVYASELRTDGFLFLNSSDFDFFLAERLLKDG